MDPAAVRLSSIETTPWQPPFYGYIAGRDKDCLYVFFPRLLAVAFLLAPGKADFLLQ